MITDRSMTKRNPGPLAHHHRIQAIHRTTIQAPATSIRVRLASRQERSRVTPHDASAVQSVRRPARQVPWPLRCRVPRLAQQPALSVVRLEPRAAASLVPSSPDSLRVPPDVQLVPPAAKPSI